MNQQARTERYLSRGFQLAEAEALVLIEETAAALFLAFPDRFVLFGGATLVLFYESPRLSRDLDLLSQGDDLPLAQDIQKVVQGSIQPLAEVFGLGKIEFKHSVTSTDFIKIWVQSNERALFSIDLMRMGGSVLKSELVQGNIAGDNDRTVFIPSLNYMLLQKCETFLDRRYVKSRDAFDIDVLLSKGALLDDILSAHLDDFIRMKEFDREFIWTRIKKVDSKLCTAELRAILPDRFFTTLASKNFKQLRDSLELIFANWI